MFEVREILVDLKKQDYTVFMSSHMLNEVQDVCDDVALINRGKLLRSGPVDELVATNNSRRIEVKIKQRVTMGLLDKISKLDKVSELEPAGEHILVLSLSGGDDVQADLLTELLGLDLNVISFKESGVALENLYMSLIKESR